MSSFFVAGTDTNVGKTTACRAIIQALQAKGVRIVGYKPIAYSCEEGIYPVENQSNESQTDYGAENNSDVLALMNVTNEPVSYQEVNSYTFAHSLPMLPNAFAASIRIFVSGLSIMWAMLLTLSSSLIRLRASSAATTTVSSEELRYLMILSDFPFSCNFWILLKSCCSINTRLFLSASAGAVKIVSGSSTLLRLW